MTQVETIEYKVEKQDCLWNIVKANGFPPEDWKKIYEAPYNKKLKNDRPNPDVILPGDIVNIPKFKPGDLNEVVKKIQLTTATLVQVQTENGKLSADVKKLSQNVDADLKKIEKLEERAESLSQLSESATEDGCSDQYDCMGTGLAAVFANTRAADAREKAEAIRKKMKKNGKQERLKSLQEQLGEVRKKEAEFLKELGKLQKDLESAAAQPY